MAVHERIISKASIASPTLLQQLAAVLPKDTSFKIYHLSTPPTKTTAIYSAPTGTRPDRTYCESHFLSVSVHVPALHGTLESIDVLVFAIEVLIYSTALDTTFFVSKADSTGYLHHLKLPKGTPSPLRDISSTFLQHLVQRHERRNIRSVISLFARAQDQYLFPGSVEYSGKHVLDDRGLVRWWCRVLNPLIEHTNASAPSGELTVEGYLMVPGLDSRETLSLVPRATGTISTWTIGHPLEKLSRYPGDIPPRCLIPHFPDDPKARFLDELDDEISTGQNRASGRWKSVQSIDQFWDMMAFRQECSAGRLVGFIWIVFSPSLQRIQTESIVGDSQNKDMPVDSQQLETQSSSLATVDPTLPLTPESSFNSSTQLRPPSSSHPDGMEFPPASQQSGRSSRPSSIIRKKKKKKLTGLITPRLPRIKTQNKNYLLEMPEITPYYMWHPEGRGQVIVEESNYKRITELLLRLDFANLGLASSSSKRWTNEVRSSAWGSVSDAWGQLVTGTKVVEVRHEAGDAGVNTLNMGLIRKKRKVEDASSSTATNGSSPQVNVLTAGLVRKKAKT